MDEGSRKPAGLARSILDFVFRYSLVWAAASLVVAVVVSLLPGDLFFSDRTSWDAGCQTAAVLGQLILTALLAIAAMVGLRFNEKDLHRPIWSLTAKAVVWGVLFLALTYGVFVVLISSIENFPISLFFVCAPFALVVAAIAAPSYAGRTRVRAIRTHTIASAILLLAMGWAIIWGSLMPSRLAANESATIGAMRSIHGARPLNGSSFALSLASCFQGKTPAPDGSFSVAGYRFTIETLEGFGGECVVARPLVYNRSGLNTFVLAPDGVVYQRDLGVEDVPAPSTWDPKSTDEAWIVCE